MQRQENKGRNSWCRRVRAPLLLLLCVVVGGPLLPTRHVRSPGFGVVFASANEEGEIVARSSAMNGDDVPSMELDLYYEAVPMLWMSRLVYSFAALLRQAREGNVELPDRWMKEYKDQRFDVRSFSENHGLPLYEVGDYIEKNKKKLADLGTGYFDEFDHSLIEDIRAIEEMDPTSTTFFLETFDSINQTVECVYGVIKDEERKRVVISFRGSKAPFSNMDWSRNFQAHMTNMRTPKLLVPKLEGSLKENILVHQGFYEYLFNNSHSDGEQKYDQILDDIKPFVEDGYRIYVTGHSLGAALSSLLAFKLAGSNLEWIPKPITCISFASPYVGGVDFRTAFKMLEQEGLIQYLRVTNSRDPVPSIPPVSRGFRKRLFKHVGIHLDLYNSGSYYFSYPRDDNRWSRAFGNNILAKSLVWSLTYHGLPLVDERMRMHQEELQQLSLSGLYQNKTIVGDSFVTGASFGDEL